MMRMSDNGRASHEKTLLESIHSPRAPYMNEWNTLSADCVRVSSFNMFKNRLDKYLAKLRGQGTRRIVLVDSR